MVNSINSYFNFTHIGRVSDYAKNLTNSYLKNSGVESTGVTQKRLGNTASGVIAGALNANNQFFSQNKTSLSILKSAADRLSTAARSVTSGTASLVSTDSKVATANGKIYSGQSMSVDVKVNNLATRQESVSAKFNSEAASGFRQGLNSLTIRTEHGLHEVQFEIGQNDTNEDALSAIAKSINGSKAGVTASVVTEKGESSLKLVSDSTGETNAFLLQGDAAQTLNMADVQKAADASYTVNGKAYTSESNTVSIREGRTATMTLQGVGSTTIRSGADASALIRAAEEFASAYNSSVNQLASGAASSPGGNKALDLITDNRMTASSIGKYGGYAAARLSAMGITIDGNGAMQIDADKLTDAVAKSPSTVKSALAGYGGLAERTSYNAAQAMRIPQASYLNFGSLGSQNSLLSALMPQSGSLFDYLL